MHRLRSPAPWYLGFVILATGCLLLGGLFLFNDLEDGARAGMPVTAVRELAAGVQVKVSGTVVGFNPYAVIWSDRDPESPTWTALNFQVDDGTAQVFVDTSLVNGVTGFRIIEAGIHDGEYWPGDPVSVIGTARLSAYNETILVAEFVARSPTSFAHPNYFTVCAFALGIPAAAGAMVAPVRLRRRIGSHDANAPHYPYKVRIWRPCPACGHHVDVNLWACDLCGAATLWGA